jgi:hypothetical protein
MGLPEGATIDVHQHLWPAALLAALRARTEAPLLAGPAGWTLRLDGEPAYEVTPADHDPGARALREQERPEAGAARLALVSLSSPMGLEDLPPEQAGPLLAAWHAGAAELPDAFGAWAAVTRTDPDLAGLARHLGEGFAGLQVPATWMSTPSALETLTPVLEVVQRAGRPVLVHPGPAAVATDAPGWWPAVVDYTAQLSAAWWSWHEAGRALLPSLRIGFVAGAGLAPLQHERMRARGGHRRAVDPLVFVETSSYGPQAVDALIRVLGIDAVIRGSDRPYAEPADFRLGDAAARAIDVSNPRRFLFGGSPS